MWPTHTSRRGGLPLPAAYALLKLTHHPGKIPTTDVEIPVDPGIMARARTGQISMACRIAARRLRASGLFPRADTFSLSGDEGKRMAAAILFPLRNHDVSYLARMALKGGES